MGTFSGDDGSVDRDVQALRRWPRSIRYSLIAVSVVAAAASGWALGRSRLTTASSKALTAIEARQREHETRLTTLQREIAAAEQRAVAARRAAELERCHADAERIDASVAVRAAECMREQATVSACHAQNEMAKGKSMQDGCVAGLFLGVLSGGSALLLGGGGCLLGEAAGEGNAMECPVTTCAGSSDRWMPDAAQEAGRTGIPICELGVEIVDVKRSFDGGILVQEAYSGAASAGLLPGDIIVRIGSTRTRTTDDVDVALAGASHGSLIDVHFVRMGSLRSVKVQVSTHSDQHPEISNPAIGIRCDAVADVPFVQPRVVKAERDASPAALMSGDIIEQFGDHTSLRAIELVRAAAKPNDARLLRVWREGQPMTLRIDR